MVDTTDASSQTDHTPVEPGQPSRPPLARAWISIALVPVFFLLSFVAQTAIYALTGYDPSTGSAPLWANLAAGLPGLAIVLVPCVAGVIHGRRATRSGVRAGLVPEVLAVLLGLGAVALTVANL